MNSDATSRSNPVRLVAATLAALQFLVGGAALTDVVGLKLAGLLGLGVGALQLGFGEYVRGQVTPWADVVAKRAQDGTAVAGPAAQAPTGAEVIEPEAVTAVEPDPAVADPVDTGAAAAAGQPVDEPVGDEGEPDPAPPKMSTRRRRA